MIKIALQHWVFEKCIDVFFNNIFLNFLYVPKFRVGEMLDYLLLSYKDITTGSLQVAEIHNIKIIEITGAICMGEYERAILYDEPENCMSDTPDKKINFNNKTLHGMNYKMPDVFYFDIKDIVNFKKRNTNI